MPRRFHRLGHTIALVFLLAVGLTACGHSASAGFGVSAWIVSGGGAIWHTGDGGVSWHKQSSGTTRQLIGVAFCDAKHGWAVGMDGLILGTTDGGQQWVREYSNGPPLWRVACVDSQHAWALGLADAGATLYGTTDGGASWQQQLVRGATLKFGGSIAFADSRHGWLVSGGTIRATSDGGAKWVVELRSSTYRLQGVACSDARHAWVAGTLGDAFPVVLATSDGGSKWVVQHVGRPGVDISSGLGLVAVACADSRHLWAVGQQGMVAVTTNGGRSWQLRRLPDSSTGLAIACADTTHVLMTTEGQPVMTTSNGGLTWSARGRDGWLPEGPAQGIAAVVRARP